jgi:hypothetical protein
VYVEGIEGIDNVQFNYLPTLLVEVHGESIRPRRLFIR